MAAHASARSAWDARAAGALRSWAALRRAPALPSPGRGGWLRGGRRATLPEQVAFPPTGREDRAAGSWVQTAGRGAGDPQVRLWSAREAGVAGLWWERWQGFGVAKNFWGGARGGLPLERTAWGQSSWEPQGQAQGWTQEQSGRRPGRTEQGPATHLPPPCLHSFITRGLASTCFRLRHPRL